jgi:hypothetical protein
MTMLQVSYHFRIQVLYWQSAHAEPWGQTSRANREHYWLLHSGPQLAIFAHVSGTDQNAIVFTVMRDWLVLMIVLRVGADWLIIDSIQYNASFNLARKDQEAFGPSGSVHLWLWLWAAECAGSTGMQHGQRLAWAVRTRALAPAVHPQSWLFQGCISESVFSQNHTKCRFTSEFTDWHR